MLHKQNTCLNMHDMVQSSLFHAFLKHRVRSNDSMHLSFLHHLIRFAENLENQISGGGSKTGVFHVCVFDTFPQKITRTILASYHSRAGAE